MYKIDSHSEVDEKRGNRFFITIVVELNMKLDHIVDEASDWAPPASWLQLPRNFTVFDSGCGKYGKFRDRGCAKRTWGAALVGAKPSHYVQYQVLAASMRGKDLKFTVQVPKHCATEHLARYPSGLGPYNGLQRVVGIPGGPPTKPCAPLFAKGQRSPSSRGGPISGWFFSAYANHDMPLPADSAQTDSWVELHDGAQLRYTKCSYKQCRDADAIKQCRREGEDQGSTCSAESPLVVRTTAPDNDNGQHVSFNVPGFCRMKAHFRWRRDGKPQNHARPEGGEDLVYELDAA